MKKHAVLFDWCISEINRISDSDEAEAFSNLLSDTQQESFASLTGAMRNISADLAKAKAEKLHYNNWGLLRFCLEKYLLEFPSFPNEVFKQFILHTLIAEKLIAHSSTIEHEDIDTNLLEFRLLKERLPHTWFVSENRSNFENSAALFCCEHIQKLEEEINNSNISPKLIYSLLATLSTNTNDISNNQWALVKKTSPQESEAEVEAFIHLLILSTGKSLHTPREYNKPTNILNAELLKLGDGHQQWRDIHYVLSEFNSRKDTLSKYLTIYHVLENLMLKFPIVELERKQLGKMFSIRDFRKLYKEVDENEKNLLKKLIKSVFNMQVATAVTFGNHLNTRWKKLVPATQIPLIDAALLTLGINNQFSYFNNNAQGIELLTNLIYQVRCAIVHNKETEFHLTYASLDNALIILIENFLIPSLEEICFFLVGIKNNEVWYLNKYITLYK